MKVKKYRGKDVKILKERIRKELGEEAVILATRPIIEGGVLGFFGRKALEMVVAVPDRNNGDGDNLAGIDLAIPGEKPGMVEHDAVVPEKHGREFGPGHGAFCENKGQRVAKKVHGGSENASTDNSKKRAPGRLSAGSAFFPAKEGELGPDPVPSAIKPGSKDDSSRRATSGRGVELDHLPEGIKQSMGKNGLCESLRPHAGFTPLHLSKGIEGAEVMPMRAVFMGPPGAGKTTCLGRLAWLHSQEEGRTMILSLEEEGRLSGVTRWGLFWETLGLDYHACLSVEGLAQRARAAAGVVLVDTPPLEANDAKQWLHLLLELLPGFERFFVFDAGMDNEEFIRWLDLLAPAFPYRLVISKIDQVFRKEKAEKMAELAGTAHVYSAYGASITNPLQILSVAHLQVNRR
jgi:flagellar biosynthesis protein FlhF